VTNINLRACTAHRSIGNRCECFHKSPFECRVFIYNMGEWGGMEGWDGVEIGPEQGKWGRIGAAWAAASTQGTLPFKAAFGPSAPFGGGSSWWERIRESVGSHPTEHTGAMSSKKSKSQYTRQNGMEITPCAGRCAVHGLHPVGRQGGRPARPLPWLRSQPSCLGAMLFPFLAAKTMAGENIIMKTGNAST